MVGGGGRGIVVALAYALENKKAVPRCRRQDPDVKDIRLAVLVSKQLASVVRRPAKCSAKFFLTPKDEPRASEGMDNAGDFGKEEYYCHLGQSLLGRSIITGKIPKELDSIGLLLEQS